MEGFIGFNVVTISGIVNNNLVRFICIKQRGKKEDVYVDRVVVFKNFKDFFGFQTSHSDSPKIYLNTKTNTFFQIHPTYPIP